MSDYTLTRKLVKEYQQALNELHEVHQRLNEALEVESMEKLSLCESYTSALHIYTGLGSNLNEVKNLADEGTLEEGFIYNDGLQQYTFKVEGVDCISICNPKRTHKEE